MGAWDKVMRFLGFGPEGDMYEEDEEALEETQQEPLRRALGAGAANRSSAGRSTAGTGVTASSTANVVPLGSASPKHAQMPFKVLVVEPQRFDDVQAVVDQLKNRRPIILNLEGLDKDVAQKILVFLQGAIYALNGETAKIANGIFFFAPPGTDVATFGHGFRSAAAGGTYSEAEVTEILAEAPRLRLGNERSSYSIPERSTRAAAEKDVKGRIDWDWRR